MLFVNNDGAYPLAASLARAGVAVAAIVDPRPEPGAAARRLADGHPALFGPCRGRNRGTRRAAPGPGAAERGGRGGARADA